MTQNKFPSPIIRTKKKNCKEKTYLDSKDLFNYISTLFLFNVFNVWILEEGSKLLPSHLRESIYKKHHQ